MEKVAPTTQAQSMEEKGLQLLKASVVTKVSPTLLLVKTQTGEGWHKIELTKGDWTCDCDLEKAANGYCPHIYASILYLATSRIEISDEDNPMELATLRCRYCGSVDVSRAGFRYNSRGIVRRIFCSECKRKFSILYTEAQTSTHPSGVLWLLAEISMITSKLSELITGLSEALESNSKRLEGNDSSLSQRTQVGES